MDYIGCTVKSLPIEHHLLAAATAISINPANRPPGVLEPAHLALLTSRYWGAKGRKLSVSFMDNPASDLRDRILSHMNAWAFTSMSFAWTQGTGEVRISRGQGGYYSYLGTDVLHIPASQQTMNLQGFTMQTPESEYKRVVRHETGHTLGFPHEHMRRQIVGLLDRTKTLAYFLRTQGWDAQTVTQQVLTPLEDSSLMETPDADQTSIMCYGLPAEITTNNQPIPGGLDIDPSDHDFAAKLYPLDVTPLPPPTGTRTLVFSGAATLDGKPI